MMHKYIVGVEKSLIGLYIAGHYLNGPYLDGP